MDILQLERCFKKHYFEMAGVVQKMGIPYCTAKDIVEDGFVNAYIKSYYNWPNDAALKAWMYKSVLNRAKNHLRHKLVFEKFINGFVYLQDESEEILPFKQELINTVYGVIYNMPGRQRRRIIRLSYIDGLSNQEIADHLHVAINTVKEQKREGLRFLRKKCANLILN